MKTTLLLCVSLFMFMLFPAFQMPGHLTQAKTVQPAIPSNFEIGRGLKEALAQGTAKSAQQLSAVNGFFWQCSS